MGDMPIRSVNNQPLVRLDASWSVCLCIFISIYICMFAYVHYLFQRDGLEIISASIFFFLSSVTCIGMALIFKLDILDRVACVDRSIKTVAVHNRMHLWYAHAHELSLSVEDIPRPSEYIIQIDLPCDRVKTRWWLCAIILGVAWQLYLLEHS